MLIEYFSPERFAKRKSLFLFNVIDSNEDEPIEVSIGMTEHNNEQRKSNTVPTLMITVKNEMAQMNNDKTTADTGKIKSETRSTIDLMYFVDPTETATLRHIFSDAAYFLIKSRNEENISLAKSKVRLHHFFTCSMIFSGFIQGCLVDSTS